MQSCGDALLSDVLRPTRACLFNFVYRESSSVPEFWGRNSPYHPGTEFLGTPKNHLEVRAMQG